MSFCRADNCYAQQHAATMYCAAHQGGLVVREEEPDDGLTKVERAFLMEARTDKRATRRRRNKAAAAAAFATAMSSASLATGMGLLGVTFCAGIVAGIYFLFGAEDEP